MVNLLLKQPPSEQDRQHSVRQSMALPCHLRCSTSFRSAST
jgi:hypothetical protein